MKHWKIVVALVAAVTFLGLALLLRRTETPSDDDRLYQNVYIHSIAVGGMTLREANAALMERFQPGLEAMVVRYSLEGELVAEMNFAAFGARFDFSPQIERAADYSFAPGFTQRIRRLTRRTYEITDSPLFVFNAEMLEDVMLQLSATADIPVKNAALVETGGTISITAENSGRAVNIEAAAADTQEILQSLTSGTVNLKSVIAQPAYTLRNFDFTPTMLGEFSTSCGCSADDEARCRNIARAAERINNTTLYPNEVFSASEIIGAHLPNSGYEPAVVMVQGQPSEDIGGGVCQVVTTLYNAVLRAELEIVQRHNHSAQVSYVSPGFDATVAGNYYDLKFKNATEHPVLITSRVENSRLLVRIYGNETRPRNRSLRFEVRQVEILAPGEYRKIVDAEIPLGDRKVTRESQVGYHVELFKLVYEDGNKVDEMKINTSIYKPIAGEVLIGAGPARGEYR